MNSPAGLGLYSEQTAASGEALGNFPQHSSEPAMWQSRPRLCIADASRRRGTSRGRLVHMPTLKVKTDQRRMVGEIEVIPTLGRKFAFPAALPKGGTRKLVPPYEGDEDSLLPKPHVTLGTWLHPSCTISIRGASMTLRRCWFALVPIIFSICGTALLLAAEPGTSKIRFQRKQLDDKFRSEGVAVGDFNHDGKLDIAAGSVYYAAPDWKMQVIAEKPEEYDPHHYSHSFCNFADDLNGDGWTDLIVVDFPGQQTWWFENPQTAGGPWKKHEATPVTNNESPTYWDVDGNGRRELVLGFSPDAKNVDGPQRRMGIVRPTSDVRQPWAIQAISAAGAPGTMRFTHGLGVGDINKDGRQDVIVTEGWWESPVETSAAEWKFHAAPLGENCAQMYVYDFDGDGDNDVLSSSAHAVGMWWHEQKPDGWQTHLIDDSISQTHSLCLADINGDGLPDFVTGKRWWAHGPTGDARPNDPAVMCWYELSRKDGKPTWTPHQFDHDSSVGTQFEVADVNGDGLLDVVTANKKGANYFQQVRE